MEFSWKKTRGVSVVVDILVLRLGPSFPGRRTPRSLADLTNEDVVVLLWLALRELD